MTIYELIKNRQHRERIKEIIKIFFEEEFGYLVTKVNLHRHLPFKKRLKCYIAKEKLTKPEVRLRIAFEKLGPTFIKFGQLLSLRPDLIPSEYVEEFEKMQDHVPPVPFSEAKKVIETELGKPIDKVFTSFDKKPIASASIAQVYKAKLGKDTVAVKVQRPDIKEVIEEDIELMYKIAELLEKEIPDFKQIRLKSIIHEFEKWTLKELNFGIEAYYAKRIAKNFKGSKALKVPKIYDKYSTGKVLTMEYLEGIPLHNVEEIKKKKINLRKVIRNGYFVIVKQVFVDGFFHADPHPGNILVLKDGKIGLIDFGILGNFDDRLKKYALTLMQSFIDNDPDAAVRVILQMNPKSDIDKKAFREEIRDIFLQLHSASAGNIQIGPLIKEVLSSCNKHQIEVPVDFVLFVKTISIVEGVGERYQPNFKFFQETKKILTELFGYEYLFKEAFKGTKAKVLEYKELAETFPETAKDILDKIRKFKLDIDIEDADVRNLTTELEKSSGNLALGMIIAALIVGSALIMQTSKLAWLYCGGFILAGVLGLWLIKRTIFIKLKRGE